MASRNSIHNAMQCKTSVIFMASSSRSLLLIVLVGMIGLCGCQRFPGGQAMRQYQMESDRLLAEFRAEKKRREEVEARNSQLEQRLAESEKNWARSGGFSGSNGRATANNKNYQSGSNAKLMIGDVRGEREGLGSLSEYNSSRSSTRGPAAIQRGGLPDMLPSTSGLLTSGNSKDPISIGGVPRDLRGDAKGESQWRPVNRGQ